jgi:hypothetical protein
MWKCIGFSFRLQIGIQEWVEKKFEMKSKKNLREQLYPGEWSYELVVHKYKHQEELDLLQQTGITIHHLTDIVKELAETKMIISSAAGASLVDLVLLELEE